MRKINKTDFTNTRAVRVCQKVISGIVQMYEKPYICGFLRKQGIVWNFLDPVAVNFVRLSMSLGGIYVF